MAKDSAVILIVDDEEVDRAVMRRTLERAGVVVLEAATYEGAAELFSIRSGEIDLAIIDVSLPGGNGIDLGRAFLRQRRDVKFLFTSGWVGGELLRMHRIEDSERHFLPKPFRPADLVARVRSILEEPGGADWLAESNGSDSENTKEL